MVKSNTEKRLRKAVAVPDGFPLWLHPSGRWCKKIRQRLHYFGKGDDPQAALNKWLDEKNDLLAGRLPRRNGESLAVKDLCNHFLNAKRERMESGELSERSFSDYFQTCTALVSAFGKGTTVVALTTRDFERLRADFARRLGPVALGNTIGRVRSVFRYGHEAGLLESPVRFGPGFKKPSARILRQTRQKRGLRMFNAPELRAVLNHATGTIRAMILLGINVGMGNTDLAMLPISAVNLETGILDWPRPKTAIPRTVPLWPETREAICKALAVRPCPKDKDEAGLLFIGPRGLSFIGKSRGYRVHQVFARVLDKAGVKGRSFYDLRRTFQTVAEGCRDLSAVQAIMGHAPATGDMSAIYRQRVDMDRLQAVVDHVHGWLFPVVKQEEGQNNE